MTLRRSTKQQRAQKPRQPPVQVRDRQTSELVDEPLFSESAMRFLFDTKPGLILAERFLTKTWFSRLYGYYKSGAWSKPGIQDFIHKYHIRSQDFADADFQNFNQFFYRKFKDGVREFPTDPRCLGSPAEGRLLAYAEASQCPFLPIKNQQVPMDELVGRVPSGTRHHAGLDATVWESFKQGPTLILRLSPLDYHRFHAPDEGRILSQSVVKGDLFTVHPMGWASRPDVFFRNHRMVSVLETKNFGLLLYVAVGGFCVGRIRSSLVSGAFRRGQELGWFEMGGSTLLLCGQRNAFQIDSDLLQSSVGRLESLVKLGEKIATITSS